MSITFSGYKFEGPFQNKSSLKNESGVYAILCPTANSRYRVTDVGESEDVRDRVENHDRESCWKDDCNSVHYAGHYVSGADKRREIEQEIRKDYNPPCGKE